MITGSKVYNEVRPSADGNYVQSGSTTGDNLLALDTQIKKLTNLENITNDGKEVIKDLSKDAAKDAVKVTAGSAIVVDSSEDDDGNKTYKVSAKVGTVAENDAGLLTGDKAYTELRPADGHYIQQANTTAENLTALDNQIYTNAGDISNLKNLSNISNAGKNVIKNLSKDAIDIVAGSNVTVSSAEDQATGVKTYTVSADLSGSTEVANKANVAADNIGSNLKTGTGADASAADKIANQEAWATAIGTGVVGQTSNQLVTGSTVWNEVRPSQNGDIVKTSWTTGDNLLALDTQLTNLRSMSNLTSAGENKIKDLAKDAVEVVSDSSNVIVAKDTATAGKTIYKVKVTGSGSTTPDATKANIDASNIGNNLKDSAGTGAASETEIATNLDAWGDALGTGTVTQGSKQLVTGNTIYNETRADISSSANYISASNTTGKNLTALDTQVKANTDAISTLQTGVAGITLENKTYTFDQNNAEQAITYQNNGGTAFTIKINGLGGSGSGSGVTYTAGDYVDISTDHVISVKADGKVESGDTGLVTGGTVYSAITEKTGDVTKLSEAGLGDNLADGILSVNSRIGSMVDYANKGIAGAAALAALHPLDFDPDDKATFAVGYGHFKSADALAIGAFYQPNESVLFSLGGVFGNGEDLFNAGMSFKIGPGKSSIMNFSRRQLARKVDSLTAENVAQANRIAMLEAENERMQQQIEVILARMEMADNVSRSAVR